MSSFRALCEELDRVPEAQLALRLPLFRAQAERIPVGERRGDLSRFVWSTRERNVAEKGPSSGWLWDLFDGRYTPRLLVLDSAWLTWEQDFSDENPWTGRWGVVTHKSLLVELGSVLDPSFALDEKRRYFERDYELEHAADSSVGTEYELTELKDASLSLDIVLRSRYTFKLWVSGKTPAIVEVALAWSELVKHGPMLLERESISEIAARLASRPFAR